MKLRRSSVFIFSFEHILHLAQGRRERGDRGTIIAPPPHHFPEEKKIILLNMENIKDLHVNNMWDFSLFDEQDISDKK